MATVGPLQLVFIDFQNAVLPPLAHAHVDDLRRRGVVRLIDSVVAAKEGDGRLIHLETLDAPRSDPVWSGVLAHYLFGGPDKGHLNASWIFVLDQLQQIAPGLSVTEEELLEIADRIPTNSHVLILLIEHIWASELEIAAEEAEGHVIANCWISPVMLAKPIHEHQPLFG